MKKYVKILNITWMITLLISIIVLVICAVVPLIRYGAFVFKVKENMYIYLIMCALVLFLVTYSGKSFKRKCKKLAKEDVNNKILKYKSLCQNMYLSYLASGVIGMLYCVFIGSSEGVMFALISVMLISIARQNSIIVKFNLNLTEEEELEINNM